MYARLSNVIPQSILDKFRKQLAYNHIRVDERKFVGFLLIYSILLGLGISFNLQLFFGINVLIGFVVCAVGIFGLAYVILKTRSESRGKFVESILPDALQLIASNMKSGITTERSLFVAGRSEFGPLQDELKKASKRISSGERIEDALSGISEGINSPTLAKTLWLISRGIKSGGQIADLLFQLADDLKGQQAIEEETKSNISIYILLILFSAVFGAPVLFVVSSFIVQVLSKQLASTPTIDASSLPSNSNLGPITGFASGSKSQVTPDFIMFFSIVTLFFTTVFSCITIGVINTGKEINGLKYIIPLLIVAFIAFFAVRAVLQAVFGSL